MSDLKAVSSRQEFAAVPEADGTLHCKQINKKGNGKDQPAGTVVYFLKVHVKSGIVVCFEKAVKLKKMKWSWQQFHFYHRANENFIAINPSKGRADPIFS